MNKWFCGIILCVCLSFVNACGSNNNNEVAESYISSSKEKESTLVSIKVLKKQKFMDEFLSNGKIVSTKKAELIWEYSDRVKCVYVKNGDFVKEGQLLAELVHENAQLELMQSKDQLDRVDFEVKDFLIGQGFKLADSANIPQEIINIAYIKSGYRQVLNNYQRAQKSYDKTFLYAPFSGYIANLSVNDYKIVSNGDQFCVLLDKRKMEVEFPLMISEVNDVQVGTRIKVALFTDKNNMAEGYIHAINPLVDEKGLVTVKAIIDNPPQNWLDGMNVSIYIQVEKQNSLVVPKSSVVNRDGKSVVFTVKNKYAYWNYVNIGKENSSNYMIADGLQEGDSVITDGNKYLTHLSKVQIK